MSTSHDFAKQNILQWPLDKRPPYYYNQSERFADILHMLLRMRSLPPKTNVRPDGTLKAADGSDENALRWFDMIQISRKPSILLLLVAHDTDLFQPSTSKSVSTQSSTPQTRAL